MSRIRRESFARQNYYLIPEWIKCLSQMHARKVVPKNSYSFSNSNIRTFSPFNVLNILDFSKNLLE